MLAATIVTAQISSRVPGALIGLVAAGLAVALFHLDARGVSVLGALPAHLPKLALPAFPDTTELGHLVPLALVIAMVCIMQTAAVAATFPSYAKKPDDVSRDFAGVGAGCVLAGLVGAFPVDSSPPSTAIVRDSGGRSQIASLTAVALMIALVALASGLTAYVAQAALAGILIYIALRIFRLGEMIRIYRRGGLEILLVAVSAGLVIAMPTYLSAEQVASLVKLAGKARLPVCGWVAAPLAVTLTAYAEQPWAGPALVVDADEHALTWAAVAVEFGQARVLDAQALPHLGMRLWKERLLNAVADRCVRQSRRDPRDSAAAEQSLYDQLDGVLGESETATQSA